MAINKVYFGLVMAPIDRGTVYTTSSPQSSHFMNIYKHLRYIVTGTETASEQGQRHKQASRVSLVNAVPLLLSTFVVKQRYILAKSTEMQIRSALNAPHFATNDRSTKFSRLHTFLKDLRTYLICQHRRST